MAEEASHRWSLPGCSGCCFEGGWLSSRAVRAVACGGAEGWHRGTSTPSLVWGPRGRPAAGQGGKGRSSPPAQLPEASQGLGWGLAEQAGLCVADPAQPAVLPRQQGPGSWADGAGGGSPGMTCPAPRPASTHQTFTAPQGARSMHCQRRRHPDPSPLPQLAPAFAPLGRSTGEPSAATSWLPSATPGIACVPSLHPAPRLALRHAGLHPSLPCSQQRLGKEQQLQGEVGIPVSTRQAGWQHSLSIPDLVCHVGKSAWSIKFCCHLAQLLYRPVEHNSGLLVRNKTESLFTGFTFKKKNCWLKQF